MNKEKKALIEAMMMSILQIRMLGNKGEQQGGLSKEESCLVADLADAIHNIPAALINDDIDIEFLVDVMLKGFDEKYKDFDCINPYECYRSSIDGKGAF